MIVKTLESIAKRLLKKYTSDVILGALIFFATLIITVWTYTAALNGGSFYIFGGGIIFGGMLFFRAISNKEKFEKIVKNIEAERDVEVNN